MSFAESPASRGEEIRWNVRPGSEQPGKLAVVFVAAVSSAAIGYLLTNAVALAIAGFGLILGATAEFWLGTSFRLTAKFAQSRCGLSLTELAWSDVKRVIVTGSRVKLSPLENSSRLDAFRGVTLKTTRENEAAVVDYVRRHVSEQVSVEDTSIQ
jgi:hypothetical protein